MIKKTLYFGNPTYLSLRDRQLVIKLPEVEKNPDLPPSFKQNSEVTKPIEDIGIIMLDNHVCRTIDKLGMPKQITKEWKVGTAVDTYPRREDRRETASTDDSRHRNHGFAIPLLCRRIQENIVS